MSRLAVLAIACAACGDSASDPPELERGPEVSLEQTAGELLVARVGGVPIYGDCVAAQATERGLEPAEALEACIDIEVLVAEARRRGLTADPEVAAAGEREMVRALLDREFYANFNGPEDVPLADVRDIWNKGLRHYFNRSEHRSAFYCRAENPDPKTRKTPPDSDADRRAKKLAAAIWAKVRGRTGLTPAALEAICIAVRDQVGGAKVSTDSFRGFPKVGRAVPEFALPTFAIPEVGRVAPPSRTPWGYDLILLTEIIEARSIAFEDAVPQIREMMFGDPGYESYRKVHFQRWLAALMRDHHIERFDENLPDGDPLAWRSDR